MAIETTPGIEPTTEMMRTLPRAAYLSDEHFAREAERIFHREWFAVGREEAIPARGGLPARRGRRRERADRPREVGRAERVLQRLPAPRLPLW